MLYSTPISYQEPWFLYKEIDGTRLYQLPHARGRCGRERERDQGVPCMIYLALCLLPYRFFTCIQYEYPGETTLYYYDSKETCKIESWEGLYAEVQKPYSYYLFIFRPSRSIYPWCWFPWLFLSHWSNSDDTRTSLLGATGCPWPLYLFTSLSLHFK